MSIVYQENRGRRRVAIEAREEKNTRGEKIATEYSVSCYINNNLTESYTNYKDYRVKEYAHEFLNEANWRDVFAARKPVRRFGKY